MPAFALLVVLLVLLIREAWNLRRRSQVNRALHEARRPLQVLALASPGFGRSQPGQPLWQAIRALSEVDRRVNGGGPEPVPPQPIACRSLVEACVERWRPQARRSGGEIRLRWVGPDAIVAGDGDRLAAAVENLLANAVEHGGAVVSVRALVLGKRLRLEITDGGRGRDSARRLDRAGALARMRGTNRHGHGLGVVRRTIREHGGRFDLCLDRRGSTASIVLPCDSTAPTRSEPTEDRG